MKKKETLFDILLKVSELRMDIETAERRIEKLYVNNTLPMDYLEKEMIKAIKELAKESTAPDWMERDIRRGMEWMYKRLMP